MNTEQNHQDPEQIQQERTVEVPKGPETPAELKTQIDAQKKQLEKNLQDVINRSKEFSQKQQGTEVDPALVANAQAELDKLNQEAGTTVQQAESELDSLNNSETEYSSRKEREIPIDLPEEFKNQLTGDWEIETAGMSEAVQLSELYQKTEDYLGGFVPEGSDVDQLRAEAGRMLLYLRNKLDDDSSFSNIDPARKNFLKAKVDRLANSDLGKAANEGWKQSQSKEQPTQLEKQEKMSLEEMDAAQRMSPEEKRRLDSIRAAIEKQSTDKPTAKTQVDQKEIPKQPDYSIGVGNTVDMATGEAKVQQPENKTNAQPETKAAETKNEQPNTEKNKPLFDALSAMLSREKQLISKHDDLVPQIQLAMDALSSVYGIGSEKSTERIFQLLSIYQNALNETKDDIAAEKILGASLNQAESLALEKAMSTFNAGKGKFTLDITPEFLVGNLITRIQKSI